MHVFESGAKSSEPKPRYDLVPSAALRAIARRLTQGISEHGERNYEKGVWDEVFFTDRKNHAIEHFWEWIETGADDELDATIANLAMLCAIRDSRIENPQVEPKPEPIILIPAPTIDGRYNEPPSPSTTPEDASLFSRFFKAIAGGAEG